LILNASRTGEVIGARWPEINEASAMWIIPGERMKGGKEHRVPLSARAIAILQEMREQTGGEGYVFPGGSAGKPLSNMAMLSLLRRMDRSDLTVHGFRSTFRDWVAEQTNYPSELAEMALAHTVGDKVVAAYRRSDLLAKRKAMMADWAEICDGQHALSENAA
jgi:integrase